MRRIPFAFDHINVSRLSTPCFFIDRWDNEFISLRSGVFDDEEEAEEEDLIGFDAVEESAPAVGRSFGGSVTKKKITVRKSFPESWIFDGDLKLGYKLFINYRVY